MGLGAESATLWRRMRLRVLAGVVALGAAAGLISPPPALAQRIQAPASPVSIEVHAKPLPFFEPRDPQRRVFGALTYRGGLELTSTHTDFGGLSAIRIGRDGARFLAVTDRGKWVRGRILYAGEAPTGLADIEMAPILGPDGRAIAARGWYDSEALAEDDGTVWVGIERTHQILRFDFRKSGLLARGQPIALPPRVKTLPRNQGIEALIAVPRGQPLGGSLIALSERGLDGAGNTLGWIIGGPAAGEFTITRSEDFSITDAVLTPHGDMLVLERHFSMLRGVAMRIRRIPLASVRPGAVLDGPVVARADLGFQIDNMEGIAVHQTAAGEVVLTLVSDDNFSVLQRTLLLQFTLQPQP